LQPDEWLQFLGLNQAALGANNGKLAMSVDIGLVQV
jgi:hypothetical protein